MDGVNAVLAGANNGRSPLMGASELPLITPWARLRFCSPLASPSTRKKKLALPSWTSHQSKGHVIAPHELPRPTLRGLDAVSVSTLITMDGVNADIAGANICQSRPLFRQWRTTKVRPWMRGKKINSKEYIQLLIPQFSHILSIV